jgi:uncharacterized protein (TIGR02996 family)
MATDAQLLAAIAAAPGDAQLRNVYADWLEDRGDRRATFIRAHLAAHALPPDHPARMTREIALSNARAGLDRAWLAVVEAEREHVPRWCDCFVREDGAFRDVAFHDDVQDTTCDAWLELEDLIDRAAEDGRTEFAPFREISDEHIITLPASIAKLTTVESLVLYGSQLRRIPREIMAMTSLATFTPYTSYWLHWYPYEIVRCPALRDSTVSTRALYGNFKFEPPFPPLAPRAEPLPPRPCSVCDAMFDDRHEHRVWISLRVATDVLPLLVNACSAACLAKLPAGAHRGGHH